MNDRDALFAAVIAQPLEDTPRLAYADCLDESASSDESGDDDRARAAFIRTGIEWHNLGRPRFQMHTSHLVPRGDGYFEVIDGSDHEWYAPGDRVDVSLLGRTKVKTVHGLFVSKVLPDDPTLGTVRVLLKRDKRSVPFPQAEYDALRLRLYALLRDPKRERGWAPDCLPGADAKIPFIAHSDHTRHGPLDGELITFRVIHVTNPIPNPYGGGRLWQNWHWERGFVSAVTGDYTHWEQVGDKLSALAPISRVELTTLSDTFPGVMPADAADSSYLLVTVAGTHVGVDRVRAEPYVLPDGTIDPRYLLHLRWPKIPVANWVLPELAFS